MKRRRPDWIGDIQRAELLKQSEQRRRQRARAGSGPRGGRTKLEAMTREERDQLRDELLGAYDSISALVAEMNTPEALAEAEAMREDFRRACADLTDAILTVEAQLAEQFPGVQASVPVHDPEDGSEWTVHFDGRRLVWSDPPSHKDWHVIASSPLRLRSCFPRAFAALRAALVARRWITQPRLCDARPPRSCMCTGATTLRYTRPRWQLQGLPNPRLERRDEEPPAG